jgi:hypothetical protein
MIGGTTMDRENVIVNNYGIDMPQEDAFEEREMSVGAKILHWIVYWPISLAYLFFEVAKGISKALHHWLIWVLAGGAVFGLLNWLVPRTGVGNLFAFFGAIFTGQWLSYLNAFFDGAGVDTAGTNAITVLVVIFTLALYVAVPILAGFWAYNFTNDYNDRFDWEGIETKFQRIFYSIRKKSEDRYFSNRQKYYGEKSGNVIAIAFAIALLCLIIWFLPIGFRIVSARCQDVIGAARETIAL